MHDNCNLGFLLYNYSMTRRIKWLIAFIVWITGSAAIVSFIRSFSKAAWADIVAIIIFVVTVGITVLKYNSEHPLKRLGICDWNACCTDDINVKYNLCDYQGCMDSVPNWSPPDCSKGV